MAPLSKWQLLTKSSELISATDPNDDDDDHGDGGTDKAAVANERNKATSDAKDICKSAAAKTTLLEKENRK